MKDRDNIKELFSEKLGSYEAKVNPKLWDNIASQIAAPAATTGATSVKIMTKWIIGLVAVSTIIIAVVVGLNKPDPNNQRAKTITNQEKIKKESVLSDQKPEEEKKTSAQSINNKLEPETKTHVIEPRIEVSHELSISKIKGENKVTSTINEGLNKSSVSLKEDVIGGNMAEATKNEATQTSLQDPVLIAEEIEIENQTVEAEEATYKIGKLHNIFTPNGDGDNDFFFIESEGLEEFNIVVLNDRNQVVYQSRNPDFKWDGNDMSGAPVPSGYKTRYIYFITARDINGNPVNKGNSLTIIR